MEKHEKETSKIENKKDLSPPLNGVTNSPVPGITEVRVYSKSEAALFKQAENPLGDPHKV
jgi:hypothetical protein